MRGAQGGRGAWRTKQKYLRKVGCPVLRAKSGADDGTRTCDLRFTKALLYQLSYIGLISMT